jgi:hypothetical protein
VAAEKEVEGEAEIDGRYVAYGHLERRAFFGLYALPLPVRLVFPLLPFLPFGRYLLPFFFTVSS